MSMASVSARPKGMEALAVFAGFGDLVEALLGALDEIPRGLIDRRIEGTR